MKNYFENLPYITLNDVWVNKESGTTLILDWVLTKEQHYQISDLIEGGMNPNQAENRVLRQSDTLKVYVALGATQLKRVSGKILWHNETIRNEIYDQIEGRHGRLDKDGVGAIVGDGSLKHLRIATKMLLKVIQHHRKQGRSLHLRLVGSDERRDLVYRWFAKKSGLEIEISDYGGFTIHAL